MVSIKFEKVSQVLIRSETVIESCFYLRPIILLFFSHPSLNEPGLVYILHGVNVNLFLSQYGSFGSLGPDFRSSLFRICLVPLFPHYTLLSF